MGAESFACPSDQPLAEIRRWVNIAFRLAFSNKKSAGYGFARPHDPHGLYRSPKQRRSYRVSQTSSDVPASKGGFERGMIRCVRVLKGILLLSVALALCAQAPPKAPPRPNSASSDDRIAVIETRLASLDKLYDRFDRLQDKIEKLSLDIAALNTKMSVIVWIGTAIGGLLIAQLFATFTKTDHSK